MTKKMFMMFIVIAVVIFSLTGVLYYQQYGTYRCMACGMEIKPEMEEHLIIYSGDGERVYSCCQGCAFRLLDPVRGYEELRIETFCDYYGPDYKIVIHVKEHGNDVTVTPETARALLGVKLTGSCATNRFAYDQTAVDGLIEKGYTKYTMSFQHIALPEGIESHVYTMSEAAPMMADELGMRYTPPKPLAPTLILIVGIVVLVGAFVSYKKLKPT